MALKMEFWRVELNIQQHMNCFMKYLNYTALFLTEENKTVSCFVQLETVRRTLILFFFQVEIILKT